MWDRLKALFGRAKPAGPAPAAPPPPNVPPPEDAAAPAPPAAGDEAEGLPSVPHRPISERFPEPLSEQSDTVFAEARQLAHTYKLEATIAVSNVQQRYKMVRYARGLDVLTGLRALAEPIHQAYSVQLGRQLLLLAFARSLRRKFHSIVADALQAARQREPACARLDNEVYHRTRAEDLSAATRLCLDEARRLRTAGDAAGADKLCAHQIELLQRQINVRVPLDEPVAKAAVYQWLGFIFQAQGKAEQADQSFRKADEISPPQAEYRDPIAEALGDWRTVDLDRMPEDGVATPATPPAAAAERDDHEAALSRPVKKGKTASEMLRVDLPEPPNIFDEQ